MADIDDKAAAEIAISTASDPDGSTVLILSGELDSSNVEQLDEATRSILANRPSRFVFDLTELHFMDSAGIAVLVQVATEVETVMVRNPPPIVKRLIEVTGLTGVLQIES
jgi:anti-sigma B factor antagonist